MKKHLGSLRSLGAVVFLVTLFAIPGYGHVGSGDALQLFGYYADVVPAPINGNIAPDGQEEKWGSAYVRSVTFSSQNGLSTREGTILVASDDTFLYLAVGFNSQSASNSNWAAVYFDQNHDHALDGTATIPGEYYVKLTGSGPSITDNGGYFGANGWQSYGAVFPPGLEAVAEKHGTGNPQTWNFEFKIPLTSLPGPSNESFLNVSPESEIGILVQVFDASDGEMYWSPTSRDEMDPAAWGEIDLGVRGPERELAASITLGHDPSIDGNVSTDPNWQHYTTWKRQVLFTNFAGASISGTLYAKSNASNMYLGLVLDGVPATVGDQMAVYLDYNTGTGGDLDFRLTSSSENGVSIDYTGVGTGTMGDTHFNNLPGWPLDGIADGEGAVGHNGSDYEFEMRVPLAGTGPEDLQVLLGTRLGLNLEFIDSSSGDSFWWNVSANSRHQQLRVDAASFTALGWTRMQTGAPVIQPIYPKDNDEVSGHFPFLIYATSATGEAGIVQAEFSIDLGMSWVPMERADEMGFWTKTWNTTTLPDGPQEIRIRVEDSTGLENRVVLHITIDNSSGQAKDKPLVAITAPDASAYISDTSNITFSATPANIQTIVSTEISIDGGAWMAAVSPYAWNTTLFNDGSHIIQVRALQSDNLMGYSDPRLVMIDNATPEMEAMEVAYPGEQQAAKAGDVIIVTALVRDKGAGLDPSTVMLNSVDVDGASHLMVDDGTNGDAVAGDNLYSYGVTVTSTVTAQVTVSMTAQDILGNTSSAISALVMLDNADPAHVSTVSGDADIIYKNTDVIKLTTTWDGAGYPITADFGLIDSNYIPGAEQIVDNGDGTYTITYEISNENTIADATGLQITITAYDPAGNGPIVYSGFTVELDNTVPAFASVDADQDSYQDGDTVVLTAVLDDSTYAVWSDFSNIDSDYSAGDEMVTRTGNTYTVTYTISAGPTNTIPDGSYSIAVQAEDVAGNISSKATSIILDNNPPDIEAMEVSYPGEQQAAKEGDVIIITALVRDKGAGLDPSTVMLNSVDVDGASHLMVDDGTNGDAVAGDNLYSYAVTVTSTATAQVTVSMTAQDILGNTSAAISAIVMLDNTDPAHVSTVSGDADVIYKNMDVIKFTTTWDGAGYPVTADFSLIDSNYIPGAEQIVDNGDSTYTITYEISYENTIADAAGLQIPITAYDTAGNGPITYSGFTVELDNTVPAFASVDADHDSYKDGDTVVLTAVMDDSTYAVWSDFSNIDSDYSAGDETVTRVGNTYTITYTISADPTNTIPDGSYSIAVQARDVAGNISSASTSIILDNNPPDTEAMEVIYPGEQQAAKAGDVIIVTALVRDKGAGLDPSTVMLNSVDVDGASHLMVDDGTNGDAVAGDHLYSYAVTVTSTATAQVTVSMTAQDILGNTFPTISAIVMLDNTDPAHVSTVSGDADIIYKNMDVIKFTTTWDGAGYMVTADFGAIDSNYIPGAEQIVDNGDGTYTTTYEISYENTIADATGLQIPITAYDTTGNGPIVYSGFTVELDNTVPAFASVDADQDNYQDGDTVVLTAVMDDSTYAVWSDFSNIDSDYSAGDETVTRVGNTYTITYTISADPTNTIPDGSYSIAVQARDIAGNISSSSTSIELDNTSEAVTIIRPENGDILTSDVEIDVVSADDTRFVRFQISPDDGANWYNLDGTQTPNDYTEDSDATDGWTQIWHTDQDALADGMSYRIRVTAYDEMNPVAHMIGQDEVGGGLTVDNTAPALQVFVAPLPSSGPLSGDVYVPEILLTGTYFDLPDSAGVESIIIEHRNADGGHINDSPIHVPVVDRSFSQMLHLVEAGNHIKVTAIDRVGLAVSINIDLNYVIPEGAFSIGPAGGIAQSPDGTTVIIPPGALQKTVNITITSLPRDELPPTKNSQLSLLKRAHHFAPDGLVFHKPVDIVLPYTEADLDRDQNGIPDWNEQDLVVFFYDGHEWLMTDQPDRDSANNTLTLHVNHFSTFDIGLLSSGANSNSKVYWTHNPFKPNEGTTCVFKMVEDGVLSLKIYDVSGHLVRTITDKEPITATSSVRWDGMNDFDRFVGTGVYIYLVEFKGNSGNSVRIRKPLGIVK